MQSWRPGTALTQSNGKAGDRPAHREWVTVMERERAKGKGLTDLVAARRPWPCAVDYTVTKEPRERQGLDWFQFPHDPESPHAPGSRVMIDAAPIPVRPFVLEQYGCI